MLYEIGQQCLCLFTMGIQVKKNENTKQGLRHFFTITHFVLYRALTSLIFCCKMYVSSLFYKHKSSIVICIKIVFLGSYVKRKILISKNIIIGFYKLPYTQKCMYIYVYNVYLNTLRIFFQESPIMCSCVLNSFINYSKLKSVRIVSV